jgi:predicted MFS family arabinose efflux permease
MTASFWRFEGERAFHAFWFTRELVLIYPTYAIMMGEHGITPAELGVLMAIWAAAAIAFEVPTGALGDRFARRAILITSCLVSAFAFAIWLFAPGFAGFACGFVVWALGSTMASGTDEAYLHEHLAAADAPDEFERVYGRAHVASSMGIVIALVAGGWLAESGYTLPLALSALAPLGAGMIAALAFRNPPRAKTERDAYLTLLRAGIAEVAASRPLQLLVALFALVFSGYGSIEEYVGPFFAEAGMSLAEVGFLYGALFALRAIAVAFAHRFSRLSPLTITLGFAIASGCLLVSPLAAGYWPAVALGVYIALSTIGEIVLMGKLQRDMEGTARATTTSVASMVAELLAIGAFALVGVLAGLWSWGAAFMVFAALSLLIAGAIALAARALEQGTREGFRAGPHQ